MTKSIDRNKEGGHAMRCRVIGMWGGFPKENGPCSGYLIEQDDFSILLDCGSGVLMEAQKYVNLNDINHVVLSHYHYDHCSDVGAYLFSRLVNTKIGRANELIQIYGPYDEEMERRVGEVEFSKFSSFDEKSELQIGPFIFTFLRNIHPVETYSIKIECGNTKIVYTSDTSYMKELIDFAEEADLLIVESSLYEDMDGSSSGHMNSKEAGLLASQSKAKKVILTHLPHYGDLEDLLKSANKEGNNNIELAKPGMLIEL